MKALLPLALLMAACGQQAVPPADESAAAAPPSAPAGTAAGPFRHKETSDLVEFEFSWPAEAAAIPELARRFRAEMDKARAEVIGNAEEQKAMREPAGQPFHPFMLSTVYETAGQSERLLSLRVEAGGYEGGAHGNFGVGDLLWDRQANREIPFADLFAEPANRDRLLTQRWCDALNRAREEKRGEPVGGGGLFDDCPGLDDIALIPVDRDRDGRFESLQLVASPYVAGPWVEGAYEIELPVTGDLMAAIRSDYRESFEVQPQ